MMKKIFVFFSLIIIAFCAKAQITHDATGYMSPTYWSGYNLVWSDEFNEDTIDKSNWGNNTGATGWGNNELEDYTDTNAYIQNGDLVIEARRQITGTDTTYTSARMITEGKREFQYGRIDIRAKLPVAQGLWPALWMLTNDYTTAYGETDIMELVGSDPATIWGSVHWPLADGTTGTISNPYTLTSGDFSQEFHVFSLIWTADNMQFLVDGVSYMTVSNTSISSGTWTLDTPQFFIFNLAVGGNWPGTPPAATVFPQRLLVDYVRVFQTTIPEPTNLRSISQSSTTTGSNVNLNTLFNGMYYWLTAGISDHNGVAKGEPYTGQPYSTTNPELNTNYVELDTIKPLTSADAIFSVNFDGDAALGSNYVATGDLDSVMSLTSGMIPTTPSVSPITTCTTCATAADLQVGQRDIFKQPDGSYVVAVNWGNLYNNPFVTYPTGYPDSVALYDSTTAAVLQRAMDSLLTANILSNNVTVTFVDPTRYDTAIVTATSSVPAYSTPYYYTNKNFVFTAIDTIGNVPASAPLTGQTMVKIHYIDIGGNPIATVYGANYGYAACTVGQISGVTAASASVAIEETDPTVVPNGTLPSVIDYSDSGAMKLMDAAQVNRLVNLNSLGIAPLDVLYANSDTTYSIPYPCGADTDYYAFYATPATLPITDLQLNAQLQNANDVLLTWETATEINSKTFALQRSNNGGKTWVSINTQASKAKDGNSSVPLSYQFADNALPIGNYLYRVIETDIDGYTTLSNTVQIQITENGGLMIYPNPANNTVNVLLPGDVNTATYRLIGADGKIVQTGALEKVIGNYGQLNISSIASGVYFLQIIANNNTQTVKVQVQH
jgi:beta-glucanase (GH16 family)